MSQNILRESDLHAYVDELLPLEEQIAIEDFLADHPDEAERIRDYRAQKQSLKNIYDPLLDDPIPEHLRALAAPPQTNASHEPYRHPFTRWSLQRIAAGFLIAIISGAAGWLANDQFKSSDKIAKMVPLARQAAIAHVVFTPDIRRPVEVSGAQEDQLVAWLSKRLGTPVKPPKLGAQGYELIGGRLLPGNIGPVAQFMYQDASGQRLTLFISTENTSNQETAFRFAQEGTVSVFYWIDGKFGYALSATIDKGQLARLATAVYEQIEGQ
ncbi:MAG: anti-sigma factor [Betaproteobacteria bacterium]